MVIRCRIASATEASAVLQQILTDYSDNKLLRERYLKYNQALGYNAALMIIALQDDIIVGHSILTMQGSGDFTPKVKELYVQHSGLYEGVEIELLSFLEKLLLQKGFQTVSIEVRADDVKTLIGILNAGYLSFSYCQIGPTQDLYLTYSKYLPRS